jgi:hypothetical protein
MAYRTSHQRQVTGTVTGIGRFRFARLQAAMRLQTVVAHHPPGRTQTERTPGGESLRAAAYLHQSGFTTSRI